MVTLFPICYISQLKHLEINAKAREAPIIHKAKTIESLGIKKRDELKSLCNPYHVTSVYYFTVVYIIPWVPEVFFRVRRDASFRRKQADTCSAKGR